MPRQHRTATVAVAILSAVELVAGVTGAAALAAADDDESNDRTRRAGSQADDAGPDSPPGREGCRSALAAVEPAGGDVLRVVADDSEGAYDSINGALDDAEPGDVVRVSEGTYEEEVRSVRAGEEDAPIRIVGPGAHIEGEETDEGRLIEITHDHVTLEGFEVSNADKLLWIEAATGVRVLCNDFHDAGGECIRLKVFASENEIARNVVHECGQENFDLDDDRKNGEGVYIGTAPEQLDRNPTDEPDESNRNWVHHNLISVPAECVDLKEAATGNVVEDNLCVGSEDPDNAGFSSRGRETILRRNVSMGHEGAGIRLGGDSERDGTDSLVVANELVDNEGYGLKVMAEPQELICGNSLSGNGDGPVTPDGIDPTRECPGNEAEERGLPSLTTPPATPTRSSSRERRGPQPTASGGPGLRPAPDHVTGSTPSTSNEPPTAGTTGPEPTETVETVETDGENEATGGTEDPQSTEEGGDDTDLLATVEETVQPVTETLEPAADDGLV